MGIATIGNLILISANGLLVTRCLWLLLLLRNQKGIEWPSSVQVDKDVPLIILSATSV